MVSPTHSRLFDPAESARLEDPQRLNYMPPGALVSHLGVAEEMVIADIGAGTGFFALPMATAVGPKGKIYAVDLQAEMLEKLRTKLAQPQAPRNIVLLRGPSTETNVPTGSCDRVLIANVWHEIDDFSGTLREVARLLKPGGKLAILDWRPEELPPPGPPTDHRMPMEQVKRALENERWLCLSTDLFGAHSYLVQAQPTAESAKK